MLLTTQLSTQKNSSDDDTCILITTCRTIYLVVSRIWALPNGNEIELNQHSSLVGDSTAPTIGVRDKQKNSHSILCEREFASPYCANSEAQNTMKYLNFGAVRI